MKEPGSRKMLVPRENELAEAMDRRTGERSEPGRSGMASAGRPAVTHLSSPPLLVPHSEVLERPTRRRFTAEYKLRVLQQVDTLSETGQISALLRREGLYSSHLTTWRRQRDNGSLAALRPQKRGRKAVCHEPRLKEIQLLQRQNEKLSRQLQKAKAIIAFQKKISELLEIPISQPETDENDS